MRLGLLSDLHVGYSAGTRLNEAGVNQREADIYFAAALGLGHLIHANVDAIVDLGDLAHVASPKKRALSFLIDQIRWAGVNFFSVNGNHTLTRTRSDISLYSLLYKECDNFFGVEEARYIHDLRATFIPYGTSAEVMHAVENLDPRTELIFGHWACDDADFPGDHVARDALPRLPIFLGHWHKRSRPSALGSAYFPLYIGATERLAWGEAFNPTGVAIYDTNSMKIEWIEHDARPWIDITATPDDYLEEYHYDGIEEAIVRLTIDAEPERYSALDLVSVRKRLAPALSYQIRRSRSAIDPGGAQADYVAGGVSLQESWRAFLRKSKLPKGVSRPRVEQIGSDALIST